MEQPNPGWKSATILPSAMLVAVACSQIYLTQTSELTPSKGGGFGMFAAVDMRSARMWSVDCRTKDGEPCRALIRKDEGPLGEWLGEKFRTKPDAAARAQAADRVFRMRWEHADYARAVSEARLADAAAVLPKGWRDTPLLRPLGTANASAAEPVELLAIRFQAWRMRYEAESGRLHCERIGAPEIRGEW